MLESLSWLALPGLLLLIACLCFLALYLRRLGLLECLGLLLSNSKVTLRAWDTFLGYFSDLASHGQVTFWPLPSPPHCATVTLSLTYCTFAPIGLSELKHMVMACAKPITGWELNRMWQSYGLDEVNVADLLLTLKRNYKDYECNQVQF